LKKSKQNTDMTQNQYYLLYNKLLHLVS